MGGKDRGCLPEVVGELAVGGSCPEEGADLFVGGNNETGYARRLFYGHCLFQYSVD